MDYKTGELHLVVIADKIFQVKPSYHECEEYLKLMETQDQLNNSQLNLNLFKKIEK